MLFQQFWSGCVRFFPGSLIDFHIDNIAFEFLLKKQTTWFHFLSFVTDKTAILSACFIKFILNGLRANLHVIWNFCNPIDFTIWANQSRIFQTVANQLQRTLQPDSRVRTAKHEASSQPKELVSDVRRKQRKVCRGVESFQAHLTKLKIGLTNWLTCCEEYEL